MVNGELDERPAGALVFVPAPFIRGKLKASVVGEITFGHDELAEASLVDDFLDLAVACEPARAVAD